MNIIIDASVNGLFLKEDKKGDGRLLRQWITQGHGVVVYSIKWEKHQKEMRKGTKIFRLFEQYRRSGRARWIEPSKVQKSEDYEIDQTKMQSDDLYILALALAGDALVLYTDDGDLREDFTNEKLLPKIRNEHRSAYPINSKSIVRRQFLDRRRCPRT